MCCLSRRGCAKSKPVSKCCSYLMTIVLLVAWRGVMGWLQGLYCQRKDLMLHVSAVIPPPGCPKKEWLIAARYCQSAMWGSTFLLLLVCSWYSQLGEQLLPYYMRDLWHEDCRSLSLTSQSLICWPPEPSLSMIMPPAWCRCWTFPLEWVPQLLVPEFWWLQLLLLPLWNLRLELWSLQSLLPREFQECLWALLLDVVLFSIVYVACCADLHCLHALCSYMESTASSCLLYGAFLSAITKKNLCESWI